MFHNPHYTYMWHKQPYISWKDSTYDIAVPAWSRPLVNGPIAPNTLYDDCLTPEVVIDVPNGPNFKARPIKHWRKQLDPRKGSGLSSAGVGMPTDRPGGAVTLGNKGIRKVTVMGRDNDCCCMDIEGIECECKNAKRLKENIMDFGECGNTLFVNPNPLYGTNNLKFLNRGACPDVVDCSVKEDCKQPYDHDDPHVVCVACNPEAHVLKPASTIVKKNYYTDSRAYLKSRCKTYDQNLSGIRATGVKYFGPNGEYLYPSDDKNGPQVRSAPNCTMKCCQRTPCICANNICCKTCERPDYCHPRIIYKPNNAQYGVQGAVSSSSRLDRLKYNTITKNGSSFKTAFGSEGANAGKYHGTSTAPYFLKSKNQVCVNHHRQGNHTVCFLTPTGSIGNKHPVIPRPITI